MSVNFLESQTKVALLRAFVGESQARNRYTFSASRARRDGFEVISRLFVSIAEQEKEHARVFFSFLSPCAGSEITVDFASYPVDLGGTASLLRFAIRNETAESGDVYPKFSEVAKSEGFGEISEVFNRIAEIERRHAAKFSEIFGLIEKNKLFESDIETEWCCLNCGGIHVGFEAPEGCPVCGHPRGFFLKSGLSLG
jgi:rubrerythrin